MSRERDNWAVFGYGLAMFIPFFLMLHGFEHKVGFIRFAVCLVIILISVSKVQTFKPMYFVVLIGIYAILAQQFKTGGVTAGSGAWTAAALILLGTASARPELLAPVYRVWMKGAHLIGMVFSGLVLVIMFYGVFAPVGIVLRMIRKDLLDRRLDPAAETYWHVRKPEPFEQSHYQRQF